MDYTDSPEGQYDNMAAQEAEHREEDRRLSRYDEAIRLLRKWLKIGQYPVTETRAFLAAEPKKGSDHE